MCHFEADPQVQSCLLTVCKNEGGERVERIPFLVLIHVGQIDYKTQREKGGGGKGGREGGGGRQILAIFWHESFIPSLPILIQRQSSKFNPYSEDILTRSCLGEVLANVPVHLHLSLSQVFLVLHHLHFLLFFLLLTGPFIGKHLSQRFGNFDTNTTMVCLQDVKQCSCVYITIATSSLNLVYQAGPSLNPRKVRKVRGL